MSIAPAPSPGRRILSDVTVVAVFTPIDPLGATSVAVEGQDALDPETYLSLIDEAARRLTAYARSYRAAGRQDSRRRT